MRSYYTLCVFQYGQWNDEFGSYFRKDCDEEREFAWDHIGRGRVKIIKHDDTASAMIAARDALAKPKLKAYEEEDEEGA